MKRPAGPVSRYSLAAASPTGLNTLPGADDITRRELKNGIVVLARANFNSPSVVINGYLPAGSLFDPDEKLGLADFTASTLMTGTDRRNFQQIYDTLESAGASLGFSSGTHSAVFGGKSLAEDLDMLLELLVEVLLQPIFPTDQVERRRARLLTNLAIRAQDTADMASLTFDQIVYPGHPYSRPEDGYSETINAITRDDLAGFHRRHYGPQGLVIAVVGGVPPEQVVEKVSRVLEDWRNPDQPASPELPPLPPRNATETRRVTIPGKSQNDIILGAAGPKRRSPDYMPASLGNSVLGQFGLFGRIGERVRESAGLAYYAYSSLVAGLGPGAWYAAAGVDPTNVEKTIDLIQDELRRFVSEPVLVEELADSQANYIGRLPLSMESNSGVVGALTNLERYSLGLDYYRSYPGLVKAVTPEQVLETARRYLDPGRLGIAIAGP